MSLFLPNTIADCTRKIDNLKKTIKDGYKYVDEAPLLPHIKKHILKRISKEESYLETLEKRRDEIITDENEKYDRAVYAVANSW